MNVRCIMDVIDDLKKALHEWTGGSLEAILSQKTIDVIALETFTPAFLLDTWVEGVTTDKVKEVIQTCIERLEAKSTKKVDDREAILTNVQDWGDVIIPTELLRDLWKFGEVSDLYSEKQIDEEAIKEPLVHLVKTARQWVRFCKRKDTKEFDIQKVQILNFEAQEKLRKLNDSIQPSREEKAPF